MARSDFRSPRLHVADVIRPDTPITLEKPQAHYLCNVLRLTPGDPVLVFNGRDGEWRALLGGTGKRGVTLTPAEQTRAQTAATDLHYLFAPLKHERLDYMVQKAVELGVSRLQPVLTQRTQATRVNTDRMRSNAIEAAEQCGILNLAAVEEPMPLERALAGRQADRLLVFCDEEADVGNAAAALEPFRPVASGNALLPAMLAEKPVPVAVLIGPEGGFTDAERAMLLQQKHCVRLSLGPRILRADTAAVAALTLVQAVLGDWR